MNHPIGQSKSKVIEVRSRPNKKDGYAMIMRGIRTREAAEAWGARYGFNEVYWIRAEEKVYGFHYESAFTKEFDRGNS